MANMFLLIDYVVYFDYAAIAVFALMILSIFLRKLNKTSSSRVFLVLLIVGIVACIIDIGCADYMKYIATPEKVPTNTDLIILKISFTIYYYLRFSIIFGYAVYILIYTKSIKSIIKTKALGVIFLTPYIVILLIIIVNLFTDFAFKFIINYDINDIEFNLGPGFIALQCVEAIYCGYVIFHLIRSRKTITKTQFASLVMIVPAFIASVVLLYLFPRHLIEMLILSLSLLSIVQNVESPELLLDMRTGLLSLYQFNISIKRGYIYKNSTEVIMINVNNFIDMYHKLGYEKANEYLIQLSQMINKKYRAKDCSYVSYYLDDGLFAMVFYKVLGVRDLCEQIYSDIINFRHENTDYKALVGVCSVNIKNDFKNYDEFTNFVDNYHHVFISGVTIYSDIKNNKEFLIRYNIGSILDDAIKYNRFKVYYQPIYNVSEQTFSTAEALSRIEDPKYGIIYPDAFIFFSENKGYISIVDLNAIECVMKFLTFNNLADLGLKQITINLSPVDFNTIGFVNRVLELKKKYSFDPSLILFEITETNVIGDEKQYFNNINELKENGFKFILDDYGTGYSNLERFAKTPIDYVKIDRELVKLSNDEKMKDVLKNTFDMIHGLNRSSFIEGIETKEEYDKFMEYNCNYIQGFFFSKPIPDEEFIEFLKTHQKPNTSKRR